MGGGLGGHVYVATVYILMYMYMYNVHVRINVYMYMSALYSLVHTCMCTHARVYFESLVPCSYMYIQYVHVHVCITCTYKHD